MTWERMTLSQVAQWSSGGTPQAKNPKYYGGDFPWAVIGDLNDGIVSGTRSSITQAGLESSSAKVVPAGTLLVAMYGSIGKLGIAGVDMATNQAIATARTGKRIDSKFLFYYLLSQRRELGAAGKGATQRNISQSILKPWPVPVPPLDEQRRIVAILDDHLSRLDAADASLTTGARRLAALERAALADCRDGELRPLAEVATIQGGIQKQQKRTPRDNAFPFLRVANVTAHGLELSEVHQVELFAGELDRLRLQRGDLLVVEGNGSASQIGRAATWDGSIDDCVHQNHLIRVRPSEALLPEYLEAVWNSPQSRSALTDVASSSSGLHTLSVSKLKRLSIPVPTIDRQESLVMAAKEIRETKARMVSAIADTQRRSAALRRSLLATAFSGRLTGSSTEMSEVAGMITA